jgi:bifunctional non-homologous end joining protein LigD
MLPSLEAPLPTRRSKAPPRTFPRVESILPEVRSVPFDHPDWLFEPKYDGFRGLLHVTPTNATFLSKRRLTLKQFASLADEIRDPLRVRDAVLDGEVVHEATEAEREAEQEARSALAAGCCCGGNGGHRAARRGAGNRARE